MPSYRYTFISHAHADNAVCDPYATAFGRLGVPHYYDRANPQIGHDVGEALERELQQAQALVVLASPQSLASPWVREELNIFFSLMMRDTSRLLIPVKVAPCDLPPRLEARWWVDGVGRPASEVVAELARALEHGAAPLSAQTMAQPAQPSIQTRIVDQRAGMGDHATLAEAIAAARPGERILIRKGVYDGGLVIDKPLELIGDGNPGDVEIRAFSKSVITFSASWGRIANIALYQTGTKGWFKSFACVDITGGRLELEDCDISSQDLSCIHIHDGADPRVRRCRVHDSAQGAGIAIFDRGQGVIEDCEIFANALSGVEIKTGSAPTVRQCRMHDNKGVGALVWEKGQGVIEDCEIFANALSGVEIKAGSATVRQCRIHDNKGSGVMVWEKGQGLIEDCDISASGYHGVESRAGGAPTVRRNRILRSTWYGGYIWQNGGGVFEANELRENAQGAWNIADDSAANVTRKDNIE